jgi:diguanylate cyclase
MSESVPYAEDDKERASEYLRQAIPLLTRNGIPPSPLNYRLAYDHVAGRSESLQRRLGELLEQSGPPSAETLWALYREFFLPDYETLETLRDELRQIISRVQGELAHSGDDLCAYSRLLSGFAEVLGDASARDRLAEETRRVIAETHSVEERQRHLESGITAVIDEVEILRRELEQARRESLTDSLTGIANRKAFDAALLAGLQQALQSRRPLTLLLLDIDRFKQFNDTYGHLVGDKVLRFVAETLRHSVKGRDMVARYGGEEFAVILPDTALIGGEAVAQQIRRNISAGELRDDGRGESFGQITASFGVAQARWNEAPESLIERVDRALYTAKQRGRNRVEKAV